MEAFYPEIRAIHIGAVILSGLLLLLRGIAHNGFGASWVTAWPVRSLSYTIDTVLLTAALMLTTIIHQYPFVDSWLTMKMLLLVGYICLGYNALRGGAARRRWASLGGAALVYGLIISVARAHSPLGIFAQFHWYAGFRSRTFQNFPAAGRLYLRSMISTRHFRSLACVVVASSRKGMSRPSSVA